MDVIIVAVVAVLTGFAVSKFVYSAHTHKYLHDGCNYSIRN